MSSTQDEHIQFNLEIFSVKRISFERGPHPAQWGSRRGPFWSDLFQMNLFFEAENHPNFLHFLNVERNRDRSKHPVPISMKGALTKLERAQSLEIEYSGLGAHYMKSFLCFECSQRY